MENFSERLRGLCFDNKIKQAELARQLDISRQVLSNIINGGSEPSYAMLCKMADQFHVTTDYLLGQSFSKIPLTGENTSDGLDALIANLKSCAFKAMFGLTDSLNSLLGQTLVKHKNAGVDIDNLVLKAVSDALREWSGFVDSVGSVNKNRNSGKEGATNRLFWMADSVRNIILKNGNEVILRYYPNNEDNESERR